MSLPFAQAGIPIAFGPAAAGEGASAAMITTS
jgi:hypothetical protein